MGKVALVTGGSRGIGAAICEKLAKDGYSIAINYVSNAKNAEDVAQKVEKNYGVKATTFQANVSNAGECKKLIQNVIAAFGELTCLVCNAGYLDLKPFEQATEADFEKSFDTNVKGPIFLAQEAGKHMRPGSAIIFLSTNLTVGQSVNGNYAMYVATKGAVEQFARSIVREYAANKGIRVNIVSPGPTATEMFTKGKSQELIDKIASASPYNRLGEPEEVADAVAFLVSDRAAFVLGQNIRVSGGQTI